MKLKHFLPITVWMISLIGIAVASSPHSTDDDNCVGCHNELITKSTGHFIESNDDCMFCHEQGPSGEVLSFQSDNLICLSCHADHDAGLSAAGHTGMNCVECHDPHSSDQPHLFVRSELAVCANGCHGSHDLGLSHPTGDGTTDVNTGSMVTCVSTCHSMHASRDDKMLQMAGTDLCYQCHDDKF